MRRTTWYVCPRCGDMYTHPCRCAGCGSRVERSKPVSDADIKHITRLREDICDATAEIGELKASGQWHMTPARAEALGQAIERAMDQLRQAEKALKADYGLAYDDEMPFRAEPVTTAVRMLEEVGRWTMNRR